MQHLTVITTGGTIDKVYFDAQSQFEVGESEVPQILKNSNVTLPFQVTNLLHKDSLDLRADSQQRGGALLRSHPRPGPGVEGTTSGEHGGVDIGRRRFRDTSDQLLRGG